MYPKIVNHQYNYIQQYNMSNPDYYNIFQDTKTNQLLKNLLKKKKASQTGNIRGLLKPTNTHYSLQEYLKYLKDKQDQSKKQTLTLSQFMDKLKSVNSTATKRKKSSTEQPSTQKKTAQPYEDSGKVSHSTPPTDQRIRTENSQQTVSQQSFIEKEDPILLEDLNLEGKVDQLAKEIHLLKRKSEELEMQNKLLFESMHKLGLEKEVQSQERLQLLKKLDTMIEMQHRQEQNLNYFKSIFQNGSMIESILQKRIKTDSTASQKQASHLQYRHSLPSSPGLRKQENRQRHLSVKSDHQPYDIL